MARPLRPDTLGGRHHVVAVRTRNEEQKPNLAGFWVCVGDFVAVDDAGNDPTCTSASSPPYENGMTYAASPYSPVRFRHGLDGRLEWDGVPDDVTFGSVMTTLPAEWRPDTPQTYFRDVLVGSVLVPSRWVVATNGEVTIYPFSSGGAGEWCRLGIDSDFQVAPNTHTAIDWNIEANHDPDTYEIVDSPLGGNGNAISVLKDGIYAITFGLYLDVFTPLIPTNCNFGATIERTSWTNEEEAYEFLLDNALVNRYSSPIVTGTKVFRNGPAFNSIYMTIVLPSGADSDLGFIGDDLNITYMEIMRLVPLDYAQTNPYSFVTGP